MISLKDWFTAFSLYSKKMTLIRKLSKLIHLWKKKIDGSSSYDMRAWKYNVSDYLLWINYMVFMFAHLLNLFYRAVVSLNEKNRCMGISAKNQATTNVKNTISCFKRLMGRRFDDPQVQREINHHFTPYQIVRGQSGETLIQVLVYFSF